LLLLFAIVGGVAISKFLFFVLIGIIWLSHPGKGAGAGGGGAH